MSSHPYLVQLEPSLFNNRDVYAVFGNPIAHSKSPMIHEQFAKNSAQNLVYLRIQPEPNDFTKRCTEFFQMGGKGLSVTVPFKLEAYVLCQQHSARAQLAGAVNTLWLEKGQLVGDNTDGIGLVRDLISQGIALRNQRILILGAGGATRGIIGPILEAKPASVIVANRTLHKATELVSSMQDLANSLALDLEAWPLERLEQEPDRSFDLVINASAAGLDQQSPLSHLAASHLFHSSLFAYDLLYGKMTPFMQQALERGCRVSDGLGMLVEQAAEAFSLWRTLPIDRLNTRAVLANLRHA